MAEDLGEPIFHLGFEGGSSAVSRFALTFGPGPVGALDRAPEQTQNSGRDRVAHPALILARADIPAIVPSVRAASIQV